MTAIEPPDGFCHHSFSSYRPDEPLHHFPHADYNLNSNALHSLDDEPGWAWPAWKFGLRRDDLFGSLHMRYNTFASTIQDPEAFHHDVFEISHAADTPDEFHRLMAERQSQRLRELNESLESAAIEIIANPRLIGTEQWALALQLFRTKSLDSLVRYFSSYLPEGYFSKRGGCDAESTGGSSFAETASSVDSVSTKPSTAGDGEERHSFFADEDSKPTFTHEPFDITSTMHFSHKPSDVNATMQERFAQRAVDIAASTQLPPSPRSMTMASDDSYSIPASHASDIDTHDYAVMKVGTPARTLSFSGSESDRFAPAAGHGCSHHNDTDDEEALETSQSDFEETPITSVSDLAASSSSLDSIAVSEHAAPLAAFAKITQVDDDEDEYPPAQVPCDVFDSIETDEPMTAETPMESETPTPRQESRNTTSYLDSKNLQRTMYHYQRAASPRSPRSRNRREGSPLQRRSPEESLSRVQKSAPQSVRSRPKVRREGVEGCI